MKSSKTKAAAPTPKPPAAEAEAVPFDQVLRKLVDSKAAGTAARPPTPRAVQTAPDDIPVATETAAAEQLDTDGTATPLPMAAQSL